MPFGWRSLAIAAGLLSGPALALSEFGGTLQPSATFQYATGSGDFTFTMTANTDGDIWFSMAAPDHYSWFAVGTGSHMSGAQMWIAYGDGTSTGVTLSGRVASGHKEPTFTNNVNLVKAAAPSGPSNTHLDGMYYVSGYCKNCTNVAKNTVSPQNATQPFVWALGAKYAYPDSPSESGPLKVHDMYGYFSVDMPNAMGGNGVPALGGTMENTLNNGVVRYLDFGNNGHAFIMVVTFVIIFPLGVVLFRVFDMIRLHIIFQTIGMVLVVLGAALGIIISTMYHRSMDFRSPHQITGLVIVSGIIVQWIGGMMHHRFFVRNQRPWMKGIPINIHKMALGPILMAAGLVNAAIGWDFALVHKVNYVYIPVAGGMIVLATTALLLKPVIQRRLNRANGSLENKKYPIIGPPQLIQGYGDRFSTARTAIPLGKLASLDPALYDTEPVKPRNML